jgi:hypothetical protein
MESETPKIPRKKRGKGAMNGNETGVPFTADNQPPADVKKGGWARKNLLKNLAKAMLEQDFVGAEGSQLKAAAAQYMGLPVEEITNELMMHFRQLEKAIQKADTGAYNAFMDRAYGKPKQAVEHTGEDGGPIQALTGQLQLSDAQVRQIAKNLEKEV